MSKDTTCSPCAGYYKYMARENQQNIFADNAPLLCNAVLRRI